jgi:hypothetical protein
MVSSSFSSLVDTAGGGGEESGILLRATGPSQQATRPTEQEVV